MSAEVDVDKLLLCRDCEGSRRMKDSPTDTTEDDYGAASEGFDEERELLENAQIQTIQIGWLC